jgi:uncharacterized membrane protein YdfJ with MMPL/SSD domain
VSGSETANANSTYLKYFPQKPSQYLVVSQTIRPATDRLSRAKVLAHHRRTLSSIDRYVRSIPHVASIRPIVTASRVRHPSGDRILDFRSVQNVAFALSPASLERKVPALQAKLAEYGTAHVTVSLIGDIVVAHRLTEIADDNLRHAELIALPLVLIVLGIAFLSIGAACLPLLLAAIILISTTAALYLLSAIVGGLNPLVTTIVSVIALGLGIDYSLFLVTRFREERRSAPTHNAALEQALNTTGRAIILSGITIALTLSALLLVKIDIFTSLALGGIVAALIAVLAALTLLPATISVLGPRLDRLSFGLAVAASRRGRIWKAIAGLVTNRPGLVTIFSVALLMVLAVPAMSMRLGFHSINSLPADDPIRQVEHNVTQAFGRGSLAPVFIVTTQAPRLVTRTLSSDPHVRSIPEISEKHGRWRTLSAVLDSSPESELARDTVQQLRDRLGSKARPTYVTGVSATQLDLIDRISNVGLTVAVVSAIFALAGMAVGFRSLLVPFKAVIGSFLSVGASLGILQRLFPPDSAGPQVEAFVPLVIFVLIFGISVDYEVFLLSRIREAAVDGLGIAESVRTGLIHSSRSITLAGVTIAIVFGAFATSSIDAFQQLGIGVAIAVLLDVTIVRCLLIPAATVVFGPWNWWLPGGRGIPGQRRP